MSDRSTITSVCEDCPPVSYPTDKTRCLPCPRRSASASVDCAYGNPQDNLDRPRCIPPAFDRDGYWWVRRWPKPAPAIPLHWTAAWHANALNGWGQWSQPDREDQWVVLGPVALLNEDREKVAKLMLLHGLSTGHGDTIDDLLGELSWQINELRLRAQRP